MARANKQDLGSKTREKPSTHKANASGYAKRHSTKAKTLAGFSDIYEYTPDPKTRRSKVALEIGKDEAAEIGLGRGGASDDEGSDGEDTKMKPRLIGETGEGEMIESADDEDIDSDAAFEESDEDRFAGFSFKSSRKLTKSKLTKKRGVHFADVNLNEDEDASEAEGHNSDEEVEDEGDSDEFIDALAIFDGKGEADNGSDSEKIKSDQKQSSQRDEMNESVSEDEEDEESPISASDDDDEASPEALESLGTFISALDPSKKRKASLDDDTADADAPRVRKRRFIQERNEAGLENEFSAQASGSTKLNLEDLIAPLASQSTNLLGLKKSTKVLASMSGPKKLSAPLPQRTQERVDREAAYEQTKEEVDKWSGTMKRITEAEHLSFPLQVQPVGRVSNLELAAKFKPTTELESSIDKLLKSAKMRDEDMEQTEQLAMNHLSVEEVAARRAELRKMRELMFRAEVKAKRVSKIKSKAYRRIKKKEREKTAAKLDGDAGEDEDDEEVRLKREVERARERATLRHKNTGKWAKSMKAKGELNVDERREISEMLDRGEKLRRKIRGDKGSGDEGDEDEDESEDSQDGDGIARIKASAFEELAKMDAEDGTQEGISEKSKSIFQMKFMQDAMAQSQHQTDRMVDDFVKEMGGKDGGSDAEDGMDESELNGGLSIARTGGRVVYRPAALSGQRNPRPPSDTSSVTLQSADLLPDSPPPESQSTSRPVPIPSANEANPWLAPREAASKAPRKKNEVVVGKDSAALDKSKNKLRKTTKKLDDEKEKARVDAVVEISTESVMALDRPSSSKDAKGKGKSKAKPHPAAPATDAATAAADDDSDANSEVEEQEKALDTKGKRKAKVHAFEQRDLVARAFAGDNVVLAFEDAKRREIAADAPKTVDTTIPGWGSWGGTGTHRPAPKSYLVKKVAGIDPAARADYGKAHIIISEKRDKKAAKYMVRDLPYPYTSAAQFARSIEAPLGTEWNTRVGFQRATLPKVVKKMGTVINPLEKLF